MTRQPAILIFDIGKTAKKVLIFDPQFNVLEEQAEIFQEISDDDGFPADDLPRVAAWLRDRFSYYRSHQSYSITHCNVSGYGASLVNLDAHGQALMPFYNYLKAFPASCRTLFEQYNLNNQVCIDTASPWLGLLNSGLQLFWLKHDRPEFFKRVATTLHLPQYFASLLTGTLATETTSVGCHTMLWDYQTNDYHAWVKKENLDRLFPPMIETTHSISKQAGTNVVQLGAGVHDSSAALMPYLATQHNPFLLLSTGTWNICFNPFNDTPLSAKELASDCLCYLTYQGRPVKASRIFLGHEHEVQVNELNRHFNVGPDYYKSIKFNPQTYELLSNDASRPFYPIGMEGTGPLPEKSLQHTRLEAFTDMDEAYHQLIRYLVKWQLLSVDLVDPERRVKDLIVVGGFTRNAVFLETLKRSMATRSLLISDHPRASALGAAWLVCGKAGYAGNEHLLSVMPYK
ncbi:FGGY family carbohydrate kinase [Chryseolinea sp. T2]|uniref:FGGY-family carbohydrate kinase n=1 Tax=Chryseolinea sp. T2 TaxID=3129255 RepID=UPI003077370A